MATQIIDHRSRDYSPTLNFAATENNLSWVFTQEGDGEIYEITTNNVATLTIGGSSVSLPFSTPISVVNSTSYSVAITKINNGQTASVTINARRVTKKTVNITVPDFGDLSIRSNFILSNSSTVLVTENSNVDLTNYVGAGVWTNSIVRATISLPNMSAITNFAWQTINHIKLNNIDYCVVIGGCTARNDNFQRFGVCLINTTTLVVSDLDLNVGTYTSIFGTDITAGSSFQVPITIHCENFVNSKILIGLNIYFGEIDLINRSAYLLKYTHSAGFVCAAKRKAYYNPIDEMYPSVYGMFSALIAPSVTSMNNTISQSSYLYDYLRNVKLCSAQYFGRIKGYDKYGGVAVSYDNTTHSGGATHWAVKKNVIIGATNVYAAFTYQLSPYTYLRVTLSDNNWASLVECNHMDGAGRKYLICTNTGRLVFLFVDPVAGTIQQAYYDSGITPTSECNDKIQISA